MIQKELLKKTVWVTLTFMAEVNHQFVLKSGDKVMVMDLFSSATVKKYTYWPILLMTNRFRWKDMLNL